MNLTVQVRFGGGMAEKQVKLLAAFLPYSGRARSGLFQLFGEAASSLSTRPPFKQAFGG